MVGTPIEQPSPRVRGGTPPVSARGVNSARNRGSIASARSTRSAPATPRPTQDLVHVFIRMRPPPKQQGGGDTPLSELIKYSVDKQPQPTPRAGGSDSGIPPSTPRTLSTSGVGLTISGPSESGGLEEHRTYDFADVFEPSNDPNLVNILIPSVVEQLRSGFNAAVLCYGQTGSGKTYTMQQVTTALVDAIFGPTATSPAAAATPTPSDDLTSPTLVAMTAPLVDPQRDIVEVSYVQVYGNRSYDLLTGVTRGGGAASGGDPWGEPLPKPKGVLVSEPYAMVQGSQELFQRVADAQKRRVISQHALNPVSSRSHTLLSLRVTKCINGTPVQTVKVTLVDLAGSERVKKSGVAGENLDEAIAINKSLSVLGAVIKASCDPDGTTVVPFRESILTLYLAPVLTNSFLFLVNTISLERSNYFETKSTLDFATIAKKCVITRTRSMQVADRFRTNRGQEAIEQQLQQEIETLRQRVELLQAELELERQQREVYAQNGGMPTVASSSSLAPTVATAHVPCRGATPGKPVGDAHQLITDNLHHLETQFAALQSLLRDREAEKLMLLSRKSIIDDIRRELEQRENEREEARCALRHLLPSGGAGSPSVVPTPEVLSAAIDKVLESFMWLEEEHNKAVEDNEKVERSLTAFREEHRQAEQTILELRKRTLALEKERRQAEELVTELRLNYREMSKKFDNLEFQYHREKQERITNEECYSLHQAANFRHAELEKLRSAFEDQRSLMDTLQSRLTDVERQLESSEVTRMKLVEENKARVSSMVLAWSLFTPQQRGRYLSAEPSNAATFVTGAPPSMVGATQHWPSASGGSSNPTSSALQSPTGPHSTLFQGYDNVHLRSTLRDTQKQLQEVRGQLEHRNYRIEDLEEEVKILQERVRCRDDEYGTLLKLDSQHVEQNEEMQNQISDLFSYIDAHNARQESLENRWRESQMDIEKLEEERKESQRIINEMTIKLDRALEELREHEQNKDVLTARLKEAEAEKTTIARMRAEDQARVAELERQLQRQQSLSNDISRRLDMAVNRRHHIAAEMTHHALQGEVLQRKLVRTNGEEAKKRIAQLVKGVDQGRVLLVNAGGSPSAAGGGGRGDAAAALVDHMQRNNKVANLRFEVSQLVRQQTAQRSHDYEMNSARGAATDCSGASPPAGPHARHRDPLVGMRAPPPPQQLANLRNPSSSTLQVPHHAQPQPAHHHHQEQPFGHHPPNGHHGPTAAAHSRKGSTAQGAPSSKVQPVLGHRTVVQTIPPLGQIKFAHHIAPRSVSPNPLRSTPAPAPPATTQQVPPSAQPQPPPPAAGPVQLFSDGGAAVGSNAPVRPVIPKLTFKKSIAR